MDIYLCPSLKDTRSLKVIKELVASPKLSYYCAAELLHCLRNYSFFKI